jgi:hypothetical protein
MHLIRFDGNKTGLVIELASGIHVIDVVASIGALVPEDPISHGILNGLLKANGSWAQLLEHWEMARKGLRRLAVLAQAPGSTRVVLRRLDEVRGVSARPPRTGSAASTSGNRMRLRRIRQGGTSWNGNLVRCPLHRS